MFRQAQKPLLPQIQLGKKPNGLDESYRLFYQFSAGAMEEINYRLVACVTLGQLPILDYLTV